MFSIHIPILRVFSILVLTATSVACSVGAVAADRLVFRVFEPGVDPYYSRYLVDQRWLRIDEGRWSAQYILFDRRERRIYSVDHEAESILVIGGGEVAGEPPIPLEYRVEREPAMAFRVAGGQGEGRKVMVNGGFCQAVASLPGVLPGASGALAEYRSVLAGEHARSLAATPPELLDGCDLALNIFHADRHLAWGLPLEVWEARGYRELLIDFETGIEPEAGWNALPDDYSRFSPGS